MNSWSARKRSYGIELANGKRGRHKYDFFMGREWVNTTSMGEKWRKKNTRYPIRLIPACSFVKTKPVYKHCPLSLSPRCSPLLPLSPPPASPLCLPPLPFYPLFLFLSTPTPYPEAVKETPSGPGLPVPIRTTPAALSE